LSVSTRGRSSCNAIQQWPADATLAAHHQGDAAGAGVGRVTDGGFCGAEMRIIAFIQTPSVIDRILRHLRQNGHDARAGPWDGGSGADRGALEAGER